MENCVKGLAKVKVYNIFCSLLIYRTRHNTIEGNQARQGGFALSQYFLTVPNPLVFYKPTYYFQTDLPYYQLSQPSKDDWEYLCNSNSNSQQPWMNTRSRGLGPVGHGLWAVDGVGHWWRCRQGWHQAWNLPTMPTVCITRAGSSVATSPKTGSLEAQTCPCSCQGKTSLR